MSDLYVTNIVSTQYCQYVPERVVLNSLEIT